MKKTLIVFASLLLSTCLCAQEMIPLFDDPAYVSPSKTGEKTASAKTTDLSQRTVTASASAKPKPKEAERPLIGRGVAPLTTLVVEPLPNITFDIDLGADDVPQVKKQPVVEIDMDETDLLKRSSPLNVTESASNKGVINTKSPMAGLGRHDVSLFKIAGIGFGDRTSKVRDKLFELGYELVKAEKAIPRYRTTYYNDVCRQQRKLNVLRDVRKCILDQAETDSLHYIMRETYVRPESRESIQVSYSSPDTGHRVYKVLYENKGDHSLNSTRINVAKKKQRRDDFWNLIFETYGLPDENDKLIWGDSSTRYMKAFMRGSGYDAYLVMEDLILRDKEAAAAQSDFATLRKQTPMTFAVRSDDEDDEDFEDESDYEEDDDDEDLVDWTN